MLALSGEVRGFAGPDHELSPEARPSPAPGIPLSAPVSNRKALPTRSRLHAPRKPKVRFMSAAQIAFIAQCEECRRVWLPGDAERWQAYWIDDGPDDRLAFWCPQCAEREFGTQERQPQLPL